MIDLRLGDWRDVLADVECDALVTDPPYGARTHNGQRAERKKAPGYGDQDGSHLLSHRGISYAAWTAGDVTEFCESWSPRTRGWFCAFTSHDLVPVYIAALEAQGRCSFAPLACVQHAMNVRLVGDGPSNWTTWLVVARPRGKPWSNWGTLPGAYVGPSNDIGSNSLDRSKRPVAGGKPIWLMRAIIRDYSKQGQLICDPCAGGGTTLIAAEQEGRQAVGAEIDPDTYTKAEQWIDGHTAQTELAL